MISKKKKTRSCPKLKATSAILMPDGTEKDTEDLTPEEKEKLAMFIQSAPARVWGLKIAGWRNGDD